MALLHKHLQLLLPHATDIYSRSADLLKESPWNGSVGEKLRGEFGVEFHILPVGMKQESLNFSKTSRVLGREMSPFLLCLFCFFSSWCRGAVTLILKDSDSCCRSSLKTLDDIKSINL